jgi:5'-phosphate synthase pdxT subunit
MREVVGVLAIQGDFDRHVRAVEKCGATATRVKTVEQLRHVQRLIIPGGESSTVGLLLSRYGLGTEIQTRAEAGMPVWGTCMGMILMASHVQPHDQYSLRLMDVTVKRNAFGSQVESFETDLDFAGLDSPLRAVFIRAPVVTSLGAGVQRLACVGEDVVAVRSGNCLATSFHPELTDDLRLHKLFLEF